MVPMAGNQKWRFHFLDFSGLIINILHNYHFDHKEQPEFLQTLYIEVLILDRRKVCGLAQFVSLSDKHKKKYKGIRIPFNGYGNALKIKH